MLIRKGLWIAKGSVVFEGSSLGVPTEVDLEIVRRPEVMPDVEVGSTK